MILTKLTLVVGASLLLTVANGAESKGIDSKSVAGKQAPAASQGKIELVVSGMT
jgi:hypothetical protein